MRTALVAALTFAAGLLVGSTWLGGFPEESTDYEDSLPGIDERESDRRLEASGAAAPETGEARPTMTAETAPTFTPHGKRGAVVSERGKRKWALELLDAAYAEFRQQKEKAVPDGLRAAAARSAVAYMRRSVHNFGGWMRGYVDRQRAYGELGDPPKLILQARGMNGSTNLFPSGHWAKRYLKDKPIDFTAPLVQGTPFEVYVESGVPPLDRAMVIERLDVVLRTGDADAPEAQSWMRRGYVRVRIDGRQVLDQKGEGDGEIRGTLQGIDICTPPFDPPDISVTLQRAAVSITAHGRYVSLEEAEKLRDKSFRWVVEGDDGLLGNEPATLQVLADHGGGNPRVVRLDGSINGYLDSLARKNLWNPSVDLHKNRKSRAWVENVGAVPEGKVYRVTHIDWRARLDPKKSSHSDFIIRFKGKKLVERKAPDGVDIFGTWEGELDVHPGEERRFELECSYYAMGEAIISGSVVEPAKED